MHNVLFWREHATLLLETRVQNVLQTVDRLDLRCDDVMMCGEKLDVMKSTSSANLSLSMSVSMSVARHGYDMMPFDLVASALQQTARVYRHPTLPTHVPMRTLP